MLRLHPQYRAFESKLGLDTTLPVDVSIDLTNTTCVLLGRDGSGFIPASWPNIKNLHIPHMLGQTRASDPVVVADRVNWQKELTDVMEREGETNTIKTVALPRHPKDKGGLGFSKLHALVYRYRTGNTYIRPLTNRNGVYIDNRRLKLGECHRLVDGEVVSFVSIGPYVRAALHAGIPSDALREFIQGVCIRDKSCVDLAYIYVFQSDPLAPQPLAHTVASRSLCGNKKRKAASTSSMAVSCLSEDEEKEESSTKKQKKEVVRLDEDDDMAIVPPPPVRKEEPAAAAATSTKEVDDDLLPCSICLETVVKPHMLTCCSNNLCHLCIVQHSQSTNKAKCPMCRAPFTLGKTEHFNRALADMIDKQVQQWSPERRAQRVVLEQYHADAVTQLTNPYTHTARTMMNGFKCLRCKIQAPPGAPGITPGSQKTDALCLLCFVSDEEGKKDVRLCNVLDVNNKERIYFMDMIRRCKKRGQPPPQPSGTWLGGLLAGPPPNPTCPNCHKNDDTISSSRSGSYFHFCVRCTNLF